MKNKIAILPHPSRGEDVIIILKVLGGINHLKYTGSENTTDMAFFIKDIKRNQKSGHIGILPMIIPSSIEKLKQDGYDIYTVEEWVNRRLSFEIQKNPLLTTVIPTLSQNAILNLCLFSKNKNELAIDTNNLNLLGL